MEFFTPEFYLAKFDEEGHRQGTYPIDSTMTEELYNKLTSEGYVKITAEDWNYYVGNNGNGDNNTGYIRDAVTGKPVSAPKRVYTKQELADIASSMYQAEINTLDNEIVKAVSLGDNELANELKEEKEEVKAEYAHILDDIENGIITEADQLYKNEGEE